MFILLIIITYLIIFGNFLMTKICVIYYIHYNEGFKTYHKLLKTVVPPNKLIKYLQNNCVLKFMEEKMLNLVGCLIIGGRSYQTLVAIDLCCSKGSCIFDRLI